ncbi:MAG: hypothetical protein PHS24_02365 [Bacilli bacterium]|nr:hypothetical protein [Bacilli bacterium]
MREAIGGTWIFGIVIVFIVLFSSYLAISVNYSKAFKVKNAIVSMIEKYEGHGAEVQGLIIKYNKEVGYGVSSNCGTRGKGYDNVTTNTGIRSRYCVKCTQANTSSESNRMHKSYYNVTVFFKLDLPIVGNIFVFPVTGETKPVYGFCQM